jgi:hypothetical protein
MTAFCQACEDTAAKYVTVWQQQSTQSMSAPSSQYLLTREQCMNAMRRPWIPAPGADIGSLGQTNFNGLVPWPVVQQKLDGFVPESKSGFLQAMQLLANQYHVIKTLDGARKAGDLPFVARDRSRCRSCDGCNTQSSSCMNNWYPAFIHPCSVKNELGEVRNLAVVCFPGWRPSPSNQVHESALLTKLLEKQNSLLLDMNIRVFLWEELDDYKYDLGVTLSAMKWLWDYYHPTK